MLRHSQSVGHRQRALSAGLGFKALASTSAGFAFGKACRTARAPREMVLAHLRELVEATDVPVNADFEGGFAHDPDGVAESVRLAARPASRDCRSRIRPAIRTTRFTISSLRWRACMPRARRSTRPAATCCSRRAAKVSSAAVPTSTRRSARLKAYADAGADCLYAPGIRTPKQIKAVVEAVAPKPVNFLMAAAMRLQRERSRRARRAPHQRRRLAGARRMDGVHPRRAGDH